MTWAASTHAVLLSSLVLNFVFATSGVAALAWKFHRVAQVTALAAASETVAIDKHYAQRVSAFWGMPRTEGGIVFVGDSLTENCDWSELLGTVVLNRGIASDTTGGVQKRVAEIVSLHPRKLFLLIGLNDLYWYRNPASEVLDRYRTLVATLRKQLPGTAVYIQGLLPVKQSLSPKPISPLEIASFNKHLADIAVDFGALYIDAGPNLRDGTGELDPRFTTDGVHLNGLGYSIWRGVMMKHIN